MSRVLLTCYSAWLEVVHHICRLFVITDPPSLIARYMPSYSGDGSVTGGKQVTQDRRFFCFCKYIFKVISLAYFFVGTDSYDTARGVGHVCRGVQLSVA